MDKTFTPVGPTMHSPSNVSYSSGASHTSTRITSPDTSSHRSSPLLGDIEHASNTLLDSQPKMDRNPLHSVNEHRIKLTSECNTNISIGTTNNNSNTDQLPQQPQSLRGGALATPASRSLTSSNWRAQPLNDNIYQPFDTPSNTQMPHGALRLTPFPQNASITSYPNMATFLDMQLDATYAYCYDRGNGRYTRLIPADTLPPLRDVPATQYGCSGMVVLPQPRALSPNGRSSNTDHVPLRTPPATPSTPADNIQVSTPLRARTLPPPSNSNALPEQQSIGSLFSPHPRAYPTPSALYQSSPYQNTLGTTTLGCLQMQTNNPCATQSRIDTIVASTPPTPTHAHHPSMAASTATPPSRLANTNTPSGIPQRRPKIYCDKWVHEGVCAFTQQGCKYKHEMPFDKFTQHQLGLFHGLPAWWKKHQAELARQRDVVLGGDDASSDGQGQGQEAELSRERERFGRRGDNVGGGGVGGRSADLGGATMSAGAGNAGGGGGGGGGGVGGNMAWRRSGDSVQADMMPSSGPSMARSLGGQGIASPGVGVGSRNPTVSYGSPFGPIAPPTRTVSQTSAVPARSSIPTSNPYSSLEALEETNTAGGNEDGVRLG
ncbi:uncharacterized protein BCR38DRAFT_484838 [Pseudomassariella vexata]|uniref:C3H1-type domain-containing protein n=1 Tax=Pseudomassariella vexata TaxID=1141098 RepID=A0A1Y2E243_9PEZI|nr:uncharacterized protein BCR38DRAFT_484838 [Pseudomassariella vexata]ORY65414.1 hypothetical protein BCR38DRAFT_484838 [Pseudomassariella vexata]